MTFSIPNTRLANLISQNPKAPHSGTVFNLWTNTCIGNRGKRPKQQISNQTSLISCAILGKFILTIWHDLLYGCGEGHFLWKWGNC